MMSKERINHLKASQKVEDSGPVNFTVNVIKHLKKNEHQFY